MATFDKVKPNKGKDIDVKSISEALSLLESAAQTGSDEFKNMLSNDYNTLKATFAEVSPQVRAAIRGIGDQSVQAVRDQRDRAVENTREAARYVDQSAHESPWVYIGGAAAIAGLMGFLLGRGSRD